jgi:hypothetical protein
MFGLTLGDSELALLMVRANGNLFDLDGRRRSKGFRILRLNGIDRHQDGCGDQGS